MQRGTCAVGIQDGELGTEDRRYNITSITSNRPIYCRWRVRDVASSVEVLVVVENACCEN